MKALWICVGGLLLLLGCSGGEAALTDATLQDQAGDGVSPGDVADVAVDSSDALQPGDVTGDGLEDSLDAADLPVVVKEWNRLRLNAFRTLRAVWTDGNVWVAVGEMGTLFWNWEGQWVPGATPTNRDLYAVYGESLEDLYAVGDSGTILRYVAGQWAIEDHGIEGLEQVTLRGVWGESGHVYVVGDRGTILHKTGDNWEKEQSLVTYPLYAVWGESLLDVHAAGAGGSLLRRASGAWTTMPLTSGAVNFYAISGAVGGGMVAAGSNGTIVRQDPGGFVQELSNDTQNRDLHGVWVRSSGDVWLFGLEGALVHREGTKWLVQQIEGPNFRNFSFYGVYGNAEADPVTAVAVGESGAAVRFDGEVWNDEEVGLRGDLEDLDGVSATDALAVGTSGVLLAWDGNRWSGLRPASSTSLHAVAAYAGGYVAVGDDGTVVRVKEGTATALSTGGPEDLYGVCAASNGALVAVGELGSVYRTTDLVSWSKVEMQRFETLHDCVIDDVGMVLVVGEKGTVLRILNDAVSPVPVATLANLRRLARSAAGTVTIVGDNGVVFQGSGVTYKAVDSGKPGSFLYGVTTTTSGFVAVGWGGEVLESVDGVVSRYSIDDVSVLLQIWADPEGNLLTVGREGRAYRKTL